MVKSLFSIRVDDALTDRIPPVLRGGEIKADFIREAIARELERREKIAAKQPPSLLNRFEEGRQT